jgi:hypothetical protein
MHRFLLLLSFVASAAVLRAEAIAMVAPGGPLAVVSARAELTVGKEMSMLYSKFMYQYMERDDPGHNSRLFLRYPLYVEKGLKNLDDIVSASAIHLQVGDQTIDPREAEFVAPETLSDYPVPEDVAVAVVTFEIPRSVARLRFEVVIQHLQPNFHYHGALLAAYTPWLPKAIRPISAYNLEDHEWEVSLKALKEVRLKKVTAPGKVLKDADDELIAVPEHRQTLAVEIVAVTGGGK